MKRLRKAKGVKPIYKSGSTPNLTTCVLAESFTMRTFFLSLLLFSQLTIELIASPYCDDRCQLIQKAVQKVAPSVVKLYTIAADADSDTIEDHFEGLGSGFFVRGCVIVTNAHVVGEHDKIGVSIKGLRKGQLADVLYKEDRLDVALLKLRKRFACRPLKAAPAHQIKIGTPVLALGNPMGFGSSVTAGIVSATNRSLKGKDFYRYIQSDAVVFPGNSGGPLVSLNGQVVGITTLATTNAGLGFSMPYWIFDRLRGELKKNRKLVKRFLGLSVQQHENSEKTSISDFFAGVRVESVVAKGPAARAGLVKGDLIVDVEGKTIQSIDELEGELYANPLGNKISIRVLRNGKTQNIRLKVTKR